MPKSLRAVVGLFVTLSVVASGHPVAASAQLWKRATQAAACTAGAFAGVKIADKLADFEAKRLGLSRVEAERQKREFQIGMALALCAGGAAIAGTTYSRLSKRGQESREKEVMAALEDAKPHTYSDPESPSLSGTATAQPSFAEGKEECRIVEDRLGSDSALVKYCRPPNGKWSVKVI